MSNSPLNAAIVLIIFKRPETTAQVFNAIRQAKPKKLFVVADGPRSDRPDEPKKCAATRAILNQVDWDCEVFKDYSEVNLGCGQRLPTGLDWVFDQVDEAIILEDDCVPHPTFFRFCEENLERYRYDSRITSISGQNVQLGQSRTEDSYYFSRYNHCWGWATWKRAWKNFDFKIQAWPEIERRGLLTDILTDPQVARFWNEIFKDLYEGKITTVWDYQWTLACWLHHGLGILPNVNLVSNIGAGTDSTHFMMDDDTSLLELSTESIDFPLKHPYFMVRNTAADHYTHSTLFQPKLLKRIQRKINKQINFFSKSLS